MRVFLVRHGQSQANVDKQVNVTHSDHIIPLSNVGELQAGDAGSFLRWKFAQEQRSWRDRFLGKKKHVRIWVSPYLRTRQTADAIERQLTQVDTITVDKREHINLVEQQFGLFDGIPDEDLPNKFPLEYSHYEKCERHEGKFWARMPLGESRFDVAVRVHASFGTYMRDAKKHGIRDIIVVAHGATNRAFIMQWMHYPFEWFEKEKNPENCSIRLIDSGEDKGYIYPGG
jgi:broad specificity phosphatase PhoE